MRKNLYLLLFLFLFSGCLSIQKDKWVESERKYYKINESEKKEKEIEKEFEFLDLTFKIDQNEFKIKNEIYQLKYNINFLFKNKNNNFSISYSIYDEKNSKILERVEIKPKKKDLYFYTIDDYFVDSFCHRKLIFDIEIISDKNRYNFKKEVINSEAPFIDNLLFGPIITFFDEKDNFIKTNISINLSINNAKDIVWIRLIPPEMDSFWDIPFKKEGDIFIANGNLNYKKHPSYISNGTYILQINFGKYGLIQEEIKIIDIFNNEKGANYGITIPFELKSNKEELVLNIDFIDNIESMEIVLFDKIKNDFIKLGTKKILEIKKSISKSDLIFKDDSGKEVNIKNNYKYYYKIIIHTREINNLKYISISKFIPIIFSGFKFF
ncbi:MAG TPA: hypothetical protein PLE45_03505 [Spirochaetota bacterium]|nr:hypothetical protein [Spirochaetota bacterium]HOL56295.1 hypothetical protein [Spirochaetota bacterium]HPP03685.1 hypothetical protein [Spirochaetota bacterium]